MPALDQVRQPAPLPVAWTAEVVRERIVEAFEIEKRMPGERRFASLASSWPATPVHSFADRVGWDDARQRVWESWERAKGAHPSEVSRMEQALLWLEWLPINDRRCLAAWALAVSGNRSVSAILVKRRMSRTTFYRNRDRAAQRIADRLNKDGVQVR